MSTEITDLRQIPLDQIAESAKNPRTRFRDLDELADSIREQGVLQPISVRAIPQGDERPAGRFFPFELVFGARRLRASRMAGKATIPAVVLELDEAQAADARAAENNQREDVTPLEEAVAFGEMRAHGRTVDDIACRLGRSSSYVTARLRLLDLVPDLRTLLDDEKIGMGSALLLAQLPAALQGEAAESIARSRARRRDGAWSSSEVATLLRRATRQVSLAVWQLDDDSLPGGACSTCPKRTGTQRALLVEMEDDVCLDGECWETKTAATFARAHEKGEVVLEGPTLDRAMDVGSHFDLDDAVEGDDFAEFYGEGAEYEQSWGEALEKLKVEIDPTRLVLRRGQFGRVARVMPADYLAELVESTHPRAAENLRRRAEAIDRSTSQVDEDDVGVTDLDENEQSERAAKRAADEEREKAEAAKAKLEERARAIAVDSLHEHVARAAGASMEDDDTGAWRAMIAVAINSVVSTDTCTAVAKRRGLDTKAPKGVAPIEGGRFALRQHLPAIDTAGALRGLLFELLASPALRSRWLFDDKDPDNYGPYEIERLLAEIACSAATERAFAKKRLADEERAAAKTKKKAEGAKASRSKRKAQAERDARDGAAA